MRPTSHTQRMFRISRTLSAALATPFLLLAGGSLFAQEVQPTVTPGLTISIHGETSRTPAVETNQAAPSTEGKSLADTEAKLKVMSERLQAISKELAEVSEQNQILVKEALTAVQQAEAENLPQIVQEVRPVLILQTATPTRLQAQRDELHRLKLAEKVRQAEAHAESQAAMEAAKRQTAQRRVRHSSWKSHPSRKRVAFSGNASIEKGETVRELVLFSGNAEVQGTVENDVILLAGNLLLRDGAHIGGDAVVLAGNLTVEEGAQVDGDTVVSAGKLNVERGAIVAGEQVSMDLNRLRSLDDFTQEWQVTTRFNPDQGQTTDIAQGPSTMAMIGTGLTNLIVRFLFLAATGLLLMTFLPERVKAVGHTLRGRMAASSFIGVLAAFSLFPLGAVLTVSIVGIPLLPVLIAGVVFSVVMGMVAVASELGRLLPVGRKVPGWLLAGGALLLATFSVIPVIGPFVVSCFAIAGMGAVLLSRFGDDELEDAPI